MLYIKKLSKYRKKPPWEHNHTQASKSRNNKKINLKKYKKRNELKK